MNSRFYQLWNKDLLVARAELTEGLEEDLVLTDVFDELPLGFSVLGSSAFSSWIENRKASKHNHHLQALMKQCGCDTLPGFVDVTHAASVNDTFWVKREDDPATWDSVSLYRNDFNESISRLAFYGLGLPDLSLSTTSPELVMEGSFPKCIKKEKTGLYLYKRGHIHTMNGGLEPYCEVLASSLASRICSHAVSYDLVRLHGIPASRCRIFSNEQYGYVPMANIFPRSVGVNRLLQYFRQFPDDSEERFREMLVCDAITLNTDRHFGNFGVWINNDTVQPLGMAPVFDFNMALLPYVLDQEFDHLGDKLLEYSPKIGEDFTRIGQLALTDSIEQKLRDLKDFSFDASLMDSTFPQKRLDQLNDIVHRQMDAVLSKEVLFTKDVFLPKQAIQKQKEIAIANEKLNQLYSKLESIVQEKQLLMSTTEDASTQEILVESQDPESSLLTIDLVTQAMRAERLGKPIPLSDLPVAFDEVLSAASDFLHSDRWKERN